MTGLETKIKDSDSLKPGWLNRQFDYVRKDMKTWPEWMLRESAKNYKCLSCKKGDGIHIETKRDDSGIILFYRCSECNHFWEYP